MAKVVVVDAGVASEKAKRLRRTVAGFGKVCVLLLQARREDDPMRAHELSCFVDSTGLPEESFTPHNVCESVPSLDKARAHDAVMIGGSGDYYVSQQNMPGFAGYIDLLREIAGVGQPVFGSCYGYQSLVSALGGEIIHDVDNTEVGTIEMKLTDEGRNDPVFGDLPDRFFSQTGHKDRAARHPAGAANLVASSRCPFQALRVPGQPIWGTQFHPELDGDTNTERFQHYLDGYSGYMTDEQRERGLSQFGASPEASTLLSRFLNVVFA